MSKKTKKVKNTKQSVRKSRAKAQKKIHEATIKKKRVYKKRFLYSEESLTAAIESAKSGKTSLNKAAHLYGIPVGTLFNKLNNKVPLERRMGPSPALTREEENRVKKWILDKASIGYPMHHTIVRQAVKSIVTQLKRPNHFINNCPGRKWLKLFLNRHPEIKHKNAEILSRVRAGVKEPTIRAWFKDVKEYLTEEGVLDVLDDPSRVYNMDETGVSCCPKTGKVLAAAKEKNVYRIPSGSDRMQITVLCCFNASGVSIRPMIMYLYKYNVPDEVAASVPQEYSFGRSDNGWMTSASFYEYIVNCFHPQLKLNGVKFPVIIFFDGHKSHISIELHDYCVANDIILYCFIAHASHIMQPLDVGTFRPLKVYWSQSVAAHEQKTNKPITKVNFASIFHEAYSKLLTRPEIVQKSFEKSGIYPFNADKVDYTKCIGYRREAMKSEIEISNESSSHITPLLIDSIESEIRPDVLNEFQENFTLGTVPKTEKLLYSIWKKSKQFGSDLLLNGPDENCCAVDTVEELPKENENTNKIELVDTIKVLTEVPLSKQNRNFRFM